MSLLGAGDVFGEMAVFDGDTRSADVVALTNLRLVKLRIPPFAALLNQQAGFALALAQLEANRLRDLNRRFALQTADATTRLLGARAYLARKSSADDDLQAQIPPLAQLEIALIAGLGGDTLLDCLLAASRELQPPGGSGAALTCPRRWLAVRGAHRTAQSVLSLNVYLPIFTRNSCKIPCLNFQ